MGWWQYFYSRCASLGRDIPPAEGLPADHSQHQVLQGEGRGGSLRGPHKCDLVCCLLSLSQDCQEVGQRDGHDTEAASHDPLLPWGAWSGLGKIKCYCVYVAQLLKYCIVIKKRCYLWVSFPGECLWQFKFMARAKIFSSIFNTWSKFLRENFDRFVLGNFICSKFSGICTSCEFFS